MKLRKLFKLRSKQRGFFMNPFRFLVSGPTFTEVANDSFTTSIGGNWTQLNAWDGSITMYGGDRVAGSSAGPTASLQGMRYTGAGSYDAIGQYSEVPINIETALTSDYSAGVSINAGSGTKSGSSTDTRDSYEAIIQATSVSNPTLVLIKRAAGAVSTMVAGTSIAWTNGNKLAIGRNPSTGVITVYRERVAISGFINIVDGGTPLSGGTPGVIGAGGDQVTMASWSGGNLT